MTMQEIDRLRTELGEKRKMVDQAQACERDTGQVVILSSLLYAEAAAERNVEAALREWWAQGCKAPIASIYHDHEADAGALLSLLAYVDELADGAAKTAAGNARGTEEVDLPWHLLENMKSSRDAIRKHLSPPPPPIDPEILS